MIEFQDVTESKQYKLWMAMRQALLIVLGAIEDYLGLERSVLRQRKK